MTQFILDTHQEAETTSAGTENDLFIETDLRNLELSITMHGSGGGVNIVGAAAITRARDTLSEALRLHEESLEKVTAMALAMQPAND